MTFKFKQSPVSVSWAPDYVFQLNFKSLKYLEKIRCLIGNLPGKD